MSCIDKSEYYIQLEDDVIANPKYLKFIYQKVSDQVDNWFMLEFSSLGFIGKLFRTQSLTVSLSCKPLKGVSIEFRNRVKGAMLDFDIQWGQP